MAVVIQSDTSVTQIVNGHYRKLFQNILTALNTCQYYKEHVYTIYILLYQKEQGSGNFYFIK